MLVHILMINFILSTIWTCLLELFGHFMFTGKLCFGFFFCNVWWSSINKNFHHNNIIMNMYQENYNLWNNVTFQRPPCELHHILHKMLLHFSEYVNICFVKCLLDFHIITLLHSLETYSNLKCSYFIFHTFVLIFFRIHFI